MDPIARRSSGLFNIKNVILCRKNLFLSFEQEVEEGSAHFLLSSFTFGRYRSISESSESAIALWVPRNISASKLCQLLIRTQVKITHLWFIFNRKPQKHHTANRATVQMVLPNFSPHSGGFVGMLPVRSSVAAGRHGWVPELVLQAGHDLAPCNATHGLCAGQERWAGGCAVAQVGP